MNKNQLLSRLLVLALLALLCCGLAGAQLVSLQLVNGENYVKRAALNLTTTSTVSAARGEILDRYGRPLVTNKAAFSLVLVYSAWEKEGQFERLLDLASRVKADGGAVQDLLPITTAAPYEYIGKAADAERQKLTEYQTASEEKLLVGAAATAPEFLGAMRTYLKLPDSFSDEDARTVIGIYYSMYRAGFSMRSNYTLATGVSIDLIAWIKEHHKDYAGVEVETEAVRQYDTTYAAHLLGTVGPMYDTEWNGTEGGGPYKDKAGYTMNDTIGKTGIEKALEPYLHGTAGSRTVETSLGGDAVSEQTGAYAPEPGDNVVLTVDLDLQKAAEDSLAENISQYGYGGAAVALDINSGEVLAMASYPTFDLATYNKDVDTYNQLLDDPRNVFNNRATSGLYAPGSTFKILTAIAALEEGVIDANTTFTCTGVFEYGGQKFLCQNHEQPMTLDVTGAIKYSCNNYFYNVGKELTGARLEKWCDKFGLGKVTDIEVGETLSSQAAGPTTREKMLDNDPSLREWQGGDDVQAAIGQSDNWFTPLQLANYMAAVANHGTLYKPTLVKNIKSYDYSEVIESDDPEILSTIDFSDTTYNLVMTGMAEVTAEGGTAATVFADYPIKVGGKTGTAQTSVEGRDNGVFIAFAPFDDPQIAVCVVGEAAHHGSSVAPVVRDILDVYFKNAADAEAEQGKVETVPVENSMIS